MFVLQSFKNLFLEIIPIYRLAYVFLCNFHEPIFQIRVRRPSKTGLDCSHNLKTGRYFKIAFMNNFYLVPKRVNVPSTL